jgi:hypothetical protein
VKYARYITLFLSAICMICMFIQSTPRLRVQRDKYTAYQLRVDLSEFQFIVETGPDVSAGRRPWCGRVVYDTDFMSCSFSGPRDLQWRALSADLTAPAGRQTPCWDVHSIGAGSVGMAFAAVWFLLRLASHSPQGKQARGFEVLPA